MLNESTSVLVKVVRSALENEKSTKLTRKLVEMNNEELLKLFFKPAVCLEEGEQSNSLTTKGVKVLENYFRSWEIPLTKALSGKQHLILIHNCALPYYIDANRIVVFEREVGVLLTLASGGNNDYIEQMFPD